MVVDPFSGSNTTGKAADELKLKWTAVEQERAYVLSSMYRWDDNEVMV